MRFATVRSARRQSGNAATVPPADRHAPAAQSVSMLVAAWKVLFDDCAIIGCFGAFVHNFGEVSYFFLLTVDNFLSPSIGSDDSGYAG